MIIKFKSEVHMDIFSKINIGWSSHNKNLVDRYGMNGFEVTLSDYGEWWDTVDGDFTIHSRGEGQYFEVVSR